MVFDVVLDCDPGHDDAVALLLAYASDDINLRGVSAVAGNHTLPNTLDNVLKVCSLAGIDVPVYSGMGQPMVRDQIIADYIHGETGLNGYEFGEHGLEAESRHGVDFLIEESLNSDGLVVVPTGPLTNIGMGLLKEPRISEGIDEIVFMGGSCSSGNVTASAEFNIFADPEAAKTVINSNIPVTMIGLNVTRKVKVTDDVMSRIEGIGNPVSEMVVDLLKYFRGTYRDIFGVSEPPLHDPITIASLIDEDVLETELMRVDVETEGEHTYGETVCDKINRKDKEKNVEVGVDIDEEKFWNILIKNLKKY